ncbi:MAG TPA: glycine--tRNA ligase subunit alpha, partial [Gaiellales bacterium]
MAHTFQGMLSALQAYWEEHGCTIMQPYHTEVGAGTSNPATFLRVLGTRPWRTAYVEPSIRPDDGRYGENPFRFQQFYQYQVILKPAPADVQDLYLASLQAIGIDVPRHDVRFVEDNWENPSLGASGLGWEVWMDGMEITQFTYFQQAGGLDLDPISVELAYGTERLGMYLQGVRRAQDMQWSPNVRWSDVLLQNERQMSAYNYELADVEVYARHF